MMTEWRIWSCLLSLVAATTCSAQAVTVVRGNEDAKPRQPQLSIADDGHIFVAFGKGEEVFISRSDDGQNYSSPIKVGQLPKLALGRRRGPRIASSGESLVVAAISHQAGNLVAWRSADQGASWSEGVVVNSVPQSAREGLHGMACGPRGSFYLVWLDLRSGSTEIYLSRSTDGGASWSENVRVYRSPSGTVCECCHPSVAVGADGRVVVMWRNFVDGDRDMYLAFADDGKSFGPARKLGSGSWPLDACPMDGGDLAIDGQGNVTTVWRRRNRVYVSSPESAIETLVGKGEQPWVAASDAGPWIVWLDRRDGQLRCIQPNGKNQRLAKQAHDPVIASGGDASLVVAAWEEQTAGETRIVAQVLAK